MSHQAVHPEFAQHSRSSVPAEPLDVTAQPCASSGVALVLLQGASNAHVYSCNANGVADSNLLNAAAADRHAVVRRGQPHQRLLNAVGGV